VKALFKSYGLAVLLLGVGLALFLSLSRHRTLNKSDEASVLAMEKLKDKIEETLADTKALEATLRLNTSRFSCLSSSEDCESKVGLFLLYGLEKNSPVPLSQISEEKGFSIEGANCSEFPSEKCPLRVEAAWRPAGDPKSCEERRPIQFQFRVVLNSGSLFLDWKKEKVSSLKITASREANCKCQGLVYLAGECRASVSKELAQAQEAPNVDNDQLRLEEERKERDLANVDSNGVPECPSIINFRSEEFAVIDVSTKGETQIELEGEDNRCQSIDVFRFQCAAKIEAGQAKGEWVFAGVEKGTCANGEVPGPTARFPASEGQSPERSSGEIPAGATDTSEVLEVKQGILNEE
jgi:hypothetical protein